MKMKYALHIMLLVFWFIAIYHGMNAFESMMAFGVVMIVNKLSDISDKMGA